MCSVAAPRLLHLPSSPAEADTLRRWSSSHRCSGEAVAARAPFERRGGFSHVIDFCLAHTLTLLSCPDRSQPRLWLLVD